MSTSATRVLIIDDAVFMRSALKNALTHADGMEVIATAQNGNEGLDKIRRLKPDVVTLDVEMPGMTGLQVLEHVMNECPLPVVMVSTKTQAGAQLTLQALEMGAVDCVAKPLGDKSSTLESFRIRVVATVQAAAASNRAKLGRTQLPAIRPVLSASAHENVLVAIGISAGGPATLHQMIPAIPAQFPPIVITQHMPADFTRPFAERLNLGSNIKVKEAEANDELRPGTALIAPGNRHLRVVPLAGKWVAQLDDGPKVSGFKPSVDVLFESVASAAGNRAVGVVMTGMGCDGAAGIRILKAKGAATLAQDKDSSIVYGMPKAAWETGCIDRVVSMMDMPSAIAQAADSISGVG